MRISHEVCVARDVQGLGQQRGQAELENRIVLLQAGLEIYEILKRAGRKKTSTVLRDSSMRWFPGMSGATYV